jgi:hypothetical protein
MLYKGINIMMPITSISKWREYIVSSNEMEEECNAKITISAVKIVHHLEYVRLKIIAETSIEERTPIVHLDVLTRLFARDEYYKDAVEMMMAWSLGILTLIKIGIIKEDTKNGVYCRTTINGVNYCVGSIDEMNELYARSEMIKIPTVKEQYDNNKLCYVCLTRTKTRCQGCKVKYCSIECQKCNYDQHKSMCKKGCY